MKFGFSIPPVGPMERSDAENYDKVIQDCRLGEELGYDVAWALEHHFTPYFPTPDTLLFLAHIAALCPDLGLGTCVIVLPWHHPLRVTEQIAMLNILSRGRLYLGLGRGTARYEFDRLGVKMTETRERFAEGVQIIQQGLKGEPFSFEGKHYKIPETLIRPRVRDSERIELFGAIGSPASAEIMADLGLPLLHTSNFPDHMTAGIIESWEKRWKSNQRPVKTWSNPMHNNPTIVADTDKEAQEIGRTYFPRFAQVQMDHYETTADYWKDVPGYEIHSKFFANLAKLSKPGPDLDKYIENQLIGSPETLIRKIEATRDTLGVHHVITGHFHYEMDDQLRRRSLRMFAEQVIPHFRKDAAAA